MSKRAPAPDRALAAKGRGAPASDDVREIVTGYLVALAAARRFTGHAASAPLAVALAGVQLQAALALLDEAASLLADFALGVAHEPPAPAATLDPFERWVAEWHARQRADARLLRQHYGAGPPPVFHV
jgi:hypothetical protein